MLVSKCKILPKGQVEVEWDGYVKDWVECFTVQDWVELLRSKRLPITTPLRHIVVTLSFIEDGPDQSLELLRQLVDLLLLHHHHHHHQEVPTRCPVDTIQHLQLDCLTEYGYNGREYHLTEAIPNPSDYYCSVTKELCSFLENLPSNITQITINHWSAGRFHPQARDQIFVALSKNQHLTRLKMGQYEPTSILTDQFIPRNPQLEMLELGLRGFGNEEHSTLMQAVLNGETSQIQRLDLWLHQELYDDILVTKLDAQAFELLKSNVHLQNLSLRCHDHSLEGAVVTTIAEALTVNQSIRHLDLCGCNIGDDGCIALGKALETNHALETLNLCGCNIGDNGCIALGKALETNHALKTLDLVSNYFGKAGVHALVPALQINQTLRCLSSDCGELAFEVVRKNMHVQELKLHDCRGVHHIVKALADNKNLKLLDVSPRHGGYDDIYFALADALQVNDTLEQLILNGAGASDASIRTFLSAFHSNRTLKHLGLHIWDVGDNGASHIAEALTKNQGLKCLDITGCNIGDQGCKAIAEALQVNHTLEELDLDCNHFGDDGVRAFIPTLTVNRTLRYLRIEPPDADSYPRRSRALSSQTKEELSNLLAQLAHQFLHPIVVFLSETEVITDISAYQFKFDFDKICQELWDGTLPEDSFTLRWCLPLLGSTNPIVKRTILFLLLRQRSQLIGNAQVRLAMR